MRHAILLIERGNQNLKDIESITTTNHNMSFNSALEIGCGTGGFLIPLSAKFQQVIGIDIAFRWLILARKRLDEFGLKIQLVCC